MNVGTLKVPMFEFERMKLVDIPIDDAVGGVLLHNIADAQGHKAFNKGHRLNEQDVEKLRVLNKTTVMVGLFENDEVSENDAAARIARAVVGENISLSGVSGGRVNLLSNVRGVFSLDPEALAKINALDGITLAAMPAHSVVARKKMVATVKTIGLAISEALLQEVERIGSETFGVVRVRELAPRRVALILTGSAQAQARVVKTFTPAIVSRVEELGSAVVTRDYVEHAAPAIAQAIERAQQTSADCIIIAGETSIMDTRDVTPSGIVQAGGAIELYGAPVEPGNLLLLAYAGALPIIGAPGCVKSRDTNVVDLILPRLLAGERVSKQDVAALANGGLLIS